MSHSSLSDTAKKVLLLAKKAGVDAAEVAVSYQKGFNVCVRQGELETLEHNLENSLSITVYHQKCSGNVAISDLTPRSIETAVEKAVVIAKYTEPDEYSGLAEKSELAFDYPDCDLFHSWKINPEAAAVIALRCDNAARQFDKRIVGTEATNINTYESDYCYANSNDFIGGYRKTSHGFSCEAIAKAKDELQRDYEYSVSRIHEKLADPEWVGREAARKAVERLGAATLSTRKCPIIFIPGLAKSFWRHFLGAISGSNLYRQTSFLYGKLGEQVFPKHIQIYQDPHIPKLLGSRPFDVEGVRTRKLHYIENGILKNYALGSYSARKLQMHTTGNAGGVYNLFVSQGSDSFDALVKRMGTGLIVTEIIGQGVNILTGNYSRGAAGLWVENGEIKHPVQEVTIAGNLKEMFNNVVAVASDTDARGNVHTGSVLIDAMTVAGS